MPLEDLLSDPRATEILRKADIAKGGQVSKQGWEKAKRNLQQTRNAREADDPGVRVDKYLKQIKANAGVRVTSKSELATRWKYSESQEDRTILRAGKGETLRDA